MKNRFMATLSIKRLSGYASVHEDAIDRFGQNIEEGKINCDFEHAPEVLYTTNDHNVKDLKKEANSAKTRN